MHGTVTEDHSEVLLYLINYICIFMEKEFGQKSENYK